MQANQQLCFLKEKIQEIRSAIFFNLSQSVLRFPTSIVEALKVDDLGFVWFCIQKPKQDLREFDNEFPVRLDFFKKGKNYFLQVEGKAWIVNDPEEINMLSSWDTIPGGEGQKMDNMVLVKVKMIKAQYHETGSIERAANNTWWQNAVSNIYTWFRSANGGYRGEVFHPASLN